MLAIPESSSWLDDSRSSGQALLANDSHTMNEISLACGATSMTDFATILHRHLRACTSIFGIYHGEFPSKFETVFLCMQSRR